MAKEGLIAVEGCVEEMLQEALYRVVLPNGHQVKAFVRRRLQAEIGPLANGEKVILEMTPYDLSEGCIVRKEI